MMSTRRKPSGQRTSNYTCRELHSTSGVEANKVCLKYSTVLTVLLLMVILHKDFIIVLSPLERIEAIVKTNRKCINMEGDACTMWYCTTSADFTSLERLVGRACSGCGFIEIGRL